MRGRCVVERGANSIWPYCSVGGIVNIEVPFLCHIQTKDRNETISFTIPQL